MAKCEKHDCEKLVKEIRVGWGNESIEVCPQCEQERKTGDKGKVVFANARPGWQ